MSDRQRNVLNESQKKVNELKWQQKKVKVKSVNKK